MTAERRSVEKILSRESQASGGCVYSAPSLRATSFLLVSFSFFFLLLLSFAFSAGPGNQIHRRRHAGGCPAKKGPPRRRWRGGSSIRASPSARDRDLAFSLVLFLLPSADRYSLACPLAVPSPPPTSSSLLRVHHEHRLHATASARFNALFAALLRSRSRLPRSSRVCASIPSCIVLQSGFFFHPLCGATTSLTDTPPC